MSVERYPHKTCLADLIPRVDGKLQEDVADSDKLATLYSVASDNQENRLGLFALACTMDNCIASVLVAEVADSVIVMNRSYLGECIAKQVTP